MSKHTPGPWIANLPELLVSSASGRVLVDLYYSRNGSDDEVEANAHLIAAAPEMLEALEEILDDSGADLLHEAALKAKAAIAKAKGLK